jgi:zinc protease
MSRGAITAGLRCATAAALSATAVAAAAQPFETAPAPSAPRPFSIAAPFEQRLPNGLRVVVAQRAGVQLVTARLVLLSGSEADPKGRAGLASLVAGLLNKGTRQRSASAQAREAESLGGALDTSAEWDASDLSITVAAPMLDAALALASDAALHPTFAQAELDRLRGQVLDGLKVAYTQPGTLAQLAAERLRYGDGPYGHPAGGTPASLARVARADLLALHRERYRPDNAALVLTGDVDTATALKLAARHFGAWRAPSKAMSGRPASESGRVAPAPNGVIGMPTAAVIDMPESGQASVVVLLPLPPLGADRAAGAVLNAVVGGGYSSRLSQEVRIKRGLSYGASSQLDNRVQGGSLAAAVQTKNESAATVLSLVQAEFDKLIATPVGADELAARKATLIGGFSRAVETTAGLGAVLRSLIVAGLPLAEAGKRIDNLASVTAGDVQRLAASNMGRAGRRVVVAGDAAKFQTEMQAELPGAAMLKAGELDLERPAGLSTR